MLRITIALIVALDRSYLYTYSDCFVSATYPVTFDIKKRICSTSCPYSSHTFFRHGWIFFLFHGRSSFVITMRITMPSIQSWNKYFFPPRWFCCAKCATIILMRMHICKIKYGGSVLMTHTKNALKNSVSVWMLEITGRTMHTVTRYVFLSLVINYDQQLSCFSLSHKKTHERNSFRCHVKLKWHETRK